jgi:hypothetical protein
LAAYLEEQLNPETIDDIASDLIAQHLYQMVASLLLEQEPKDAPIELIGSIFMRAIYSKRQLYEAMVEFWSDHFNIYLRKEQTVPLAKIVDDREVIRPYTYIVSVLRVLHVDFRLRQGRGVADWMQMMGQPLFQWPPPDGYPAVSCAWAANLLPRWNFALALLHNEIPGAVVLLDDLLAAGGAETTFAAVQLFAGLVYGCSLQRNELVLFTDYIDSPLLQNDEAQARLRDCVALMLASPEFQWT